MVETRIETYYQNVKTALYVTDCPACGVVFGIPKTLEARRYADGKSFYCPNGHTMSWSETDADRRERKIRAETDRELAFARTAQQAAEDQAQAAERRRAAAKGQLTKIRNRIANGVCPCCNRSFENVRDHMATQHPDFAAPPEVSS